MSLGALTVKIGADLTDLNRGLTDAGRSINNFDKTVAGSSRNVQGLTRSATGAGAGFKALREPLTSVTRQLLHLNPAASQVSSVLGSMAIGAGPMVAVLAGVAALSLGWQKLTGDAREAAKAQEEAIKSLEKLREKQKLGPLAGTSVKERDALAPRLAELQRDIDRMVPRVAASFSRSIGGDPVMLKKLAGMQAEETRLRDLMKGPDIEINKVREGIAADRARIDKQSADHAIAQEKRAAVERIAILEATERAFQNKRGLMSSAMGLLAGDSVSVAKKTAEFTAANAGGSFNERFASQLAVFETEARDAAQKQQEAAEKQKLAAQMQQQAVKDFAISQGLSLLSQHGGAVGGILSGAISGALSTGSPWGAVIGGGAALISSLFGNRRSTDANTEAINRLNETLQNAPSGFKVAPYQFAAANPERMPRAMTPPPYNPWAFMRWYAEQNDAAAARGGTVAAYG